MGPLVVCFVLVIIGKAESVESDGSHSRSESSDSTMCVCQPHITINPPVCSRFSPTHSGIGCNSSTIQNTETVTSQLRNATHQLNDTVRRLNELQVTESGNQEVLTSEVQGLRRQLEELQVSVHVLVELIRDTSPTNQTRTADATERTPTTETVAFPNDCLEILDSGVSMSGVYTVQPLDSGEAFQVYCDMETDGGGWTVFQRRKDGSVDFYQLFSRYRRGFGNLEGEFWLGNDNLHRLTAQGEYEIRIDLSDFEDESRYAAYDWFSIEDVSDNYRLTLGSYSGTAGDSLYYHSGKQFSTKERDNDQDSRNCAQSNRGAWWYGSCRSCNLNGLYLHGTTTDYRGVVWEDWKGDYYSLKTSEMKVRPIPQ